MQRIAVLALLAASCTSSASSTKGEPAVSSASAPAAPAPAAPAARKAARRLIVVGINDTHGALLPVPPSRSLAAVTKDDVSGADWFGGYVNAIRLDAKQRGDEVVVLDAGDQFQGSLISNQFQGRSVVDVYNAIGVTASSLGNHEFDFGIAALKDNMKRAHYPMLAANIFLKGTRTRPDWAKPSVLIDKGGIKIGIIGLSTVETPLTTNIMNIADLEFADGGPIAAQEADALRARGATIVLVTAHAGPFPPDSEIQKIAAACKGKVDGIVSGHHHTILRQPIVVDNIPIVQSGHKLAAFSVIELSLDAGNRTTSWLVNDGNFPESGAPQPILHTYNGAAAVYRGHPVEADPAVTKIIQEYDVQVKKLRDSKIGATTVELRKGGKDDLLANLAADALRSGAGGGLKANFAFQNSGGLRIPEIAAGPITFGQIFDLYPFDNQQVVVSLPAVEVRNALEAVLHFGKGPLRVSGLRYTIDWQKFATPKDLKEAPQGAIVTSVTDEVTGKVLCETRACTAKECQWSCAPGTYTVSVTDFLANGGDGLSMLKAAPRQVGSVEARDIIVAFVKEHQPLTPQLLGAVSAGAPPRIDQHGEPKRPQAE
jgi:2',3'-cyclic-nucleotide 2'-phosphodiesterase (5'-nucleotidase family)